MIHRLLQICHALCRVMAQTPGFEYVLEKMDGYSLENGSKQNHA